MMFHLIRSSFAIVLVVLGGGLVTRCILGPVAFVPWARTVQRTMVEKIEQLVDRYEMELEKARQAYEQVKERASVLRGQKAQAVAGVKTAEREIQVSQRMVTENKRQLTMLEERLNNKEEIRLVSGRVAKPTELQAWIEDNANRIQLAEEKVNYLQQILARREARRQALVELEEQSPAALQRMGNSLEFLSRKLDLYRDLKQWVEEESTADSQLAGVYENAQRTLESAHASLDEKLAELDALMQPSGQSEPVSSREIATPEKLAADIRQILGDGNVTLQE